MSEKYQIRDWLQLTRPYSKPKLSKSTWQVINSFVPFIALWVLAYFALQVSFWLMLPITFLAALFTVRIFIIQHDCGHGSFLKNKKAQDELGFICGILTLTPYHTWKIEHNIHHAHSGDLDFRDIGEIETITVNEYMELSGFQRFKYRVIRNPFFLFLVAPAIKFFFMHRFTKKELRNQKKYVESAWETNAALAAYILILSAIVGVKEFFLIQGLIWYFSCCMGVMLFYVQHQFEDGYWYQQPEWNLVQSALHGSSYFKMPKIMQWFTGNIGYHHIHHLSPQIPNYELERCHNDNPVFEEEITTVTFRNCWSTMKLRFWDEKKKMLVSPKQLKHEYKPRFESVQKTMHMLKGRQQVLVAEAMQLRKKFEEHMKNNKNVEHFMHQQLMRSQLKTFTKLVKKKEARKNLQNYQQQMKEMKMLLAKYFPQFLRVQGEE